MTTINCDACGEKCIDYRGTKFEIPCHIAERDKRGQRGYVTPEGEFTSGRTVEFDLCLKCSNIVYSAAFDRIKSLKGG
jgi:hypothetical protein